MSTGYMFGYSRTTKYSCSKGIDNAAWQSFPAPNLRSPNSHIGTDTKRISDPRSLYPAAHRHGAPTPKSYHATVDEEIINDTREKTQSRSDFVGIASEQRGRRHLNFPLELEPKKLGREASLENSPV
ncbi:uncharacterized protein ARMOST_16061 [Armillaria ostoyae]|uniref:Uncharacterized protein n=1 Tax=Armillaria ostoyae TaxID=47428 RepID=A0A284RV55_ARMOS|nr:uncharacterized protein ARMOST_16061 [Armillaria ostoyae]